MTPVRGHGPYAEDDDSRRIEIVLPRARSIAWLGLKVFLLVKLGILVFVMAAVFLVVGLSALVR